MMFSDYTRAVSMQNIYNDGGFSSTGISDAIGLTQVADTLILGVDNNLEQLMQLDFGSACLGSITNSTEVAPTVSYSAAGTYTISLRASDAEGRVNYSTQTVTVTSDVAPDISFTVDDSRCISNTNSFTPSNLTLATYSWDFKGDGVEDSDKVSPDFDYSSLGTGTYTVTLTVSDGSCTNTTSQELTIYPDPPVPSFTVTSSSGIHSVLFFLGPIKSELK